MTKLRKLPWLVAVLALLTMLAVSAMPISAEEGVTRYEYYDENADSSTNISGACWEGQTFTSDTSHKILSVRLLLYRTGSPGIATVSIRAVDGSGHPTGDDLCSGTTNANTLPTGSPYEWRWIELGEGYDLTVDTQYAIVVRVESLSDVLHWREDVTAGEYPGGCVQESINSGVDWDILTYPNCDYIFEEYGRATSAPLARGLLRTTVPFAVAIGLIITGLAVFRGNIMMVAIAVAIGIVGYFMVQSMLGIL